MFANILYFLIALIIYTTADLFEPADSVTLEAIISFILLSCVFILICKLMFDRLARKIRDQGYEYIDHWVGIYINRLSILALVVFGINIYGFKIYALFNGVVLFEQVPTLKAVVFLLVFLSYLAVVWGSAYKIQTLFFPGQVSRRHFILSNISFSLPALLPWFVISIVSDLLGFVPWEPVKTFIQSPAGEFSYIAVFLVAIAVMGPVFIKTIWRCKPLENGYARARIEYICNKAGLNYADILRWELFGGAMITAGVMGLLGRFRYILVTPALLNSLRSDELDAVILHEIGHVQRYHILFYLFFFAGFVACNFVMFEPLLRLLLIFEPLYSISDWTGIEFQTLYQILFVGMMMLSFVLYFRFAFGFFMRNFERQADLHLFNFTTDASPLISTFYKIASHSHQSMEKPNWHHFSIGRRVRFLKRCQFNPQLIAAHHAKVKHMMTGFLAVVVTVLLLGYSVNYGFAREPFDQFLEKRYLALILEIESDNADLYTIVGDKYQSMGLYRKAIDAYENVLKVAPDNVHALNNLAWLLATCTEEAYQDFPRALEYARKAVSLKRVDFVLDTYAEALFVNNDVENAVIAAREALTVAKSKKEYYQGQLERFQGGLPN